MALAPGVASAQQEEAPAPATSDVKAAHQYYELGAQAYEKGDYAAALRAFEAAWAEAPNPELQFNIARCHERMFQWDAAAEAYETYLKAKPDATDAYEMKARIAELHRRAWETQHPAPPAASAAGPSDHSRSALRTGAVVTLVAAVGLAAAGTGAYLSAWNEFDNQRSSCGGMCSAQQVDGLRTRVEIAQSTGAVLWTLAGVALVTDVALWVVDARARRK
jgi:tetratricopeptide (TPR) repeat protein